MNFDELGDITTVDLVNRISDHNNWDRHSIVRRSMFSSFQYFRNSAVFLKEFQGIIFLRVADEMIPQWTALGSRPCPPCNPSGKDNTTSDALSLKSLMSKSTTLRRKQFRSNKARDCWYSVPSTCTTIEELAQLVVDSYLISYERTLERNRITHLRDLPNVNLSVIRMLRTVNVNNLAEFRNVGHNEVYKRMVANYPTAGYSVLFSLYGALNGFHSASMESELREKVTEDYLKFLAQCQSAELKERTKSTNSAQLR